MTHEGAPPPADLLRQVRRTHGDRHVGPVTNAVMADLAANAIRIVERLADVVAAQTAAAADQSDGPDLLPVFAPRNQAVDDTQQQMFPTLKQRTRGPITDLEAWHSGRCAADLAALQIGSPLTGTGEDE